MLIKNFVDFARVNVFAAANDHVALAIDNKEEAIFVAIANVAGMKPAIAKRDGSCFGIAVIAFQNVFTAQDDLAEFSSLHLVVVIVHYPHFVSNRFAAGAGPASFIRRIES